MEFLHMYSEVLTNAKEVHQCLKIKNMHKQYLGFYYFSVTCSFF